MPASPHGEVLVAGMGEPVRRPRRRSANILQLLVAPVRWTTTVAIKRLFEEEGVPARVIGASSVTAAMSQIKKDRRYRAVLVQWEEAQLQALELAVRVKERGRPPIVAFQKEWPRDDVRRALQLGVDCLLYDPFTVDELFADLKALAEEGVSRTRAEIVAQGGDDLLEPDPTLWTVQNDDWRERMMSLADQMRRPWAMNVTKKVEDLESTLRRVKDEEMDQHLAKAVITVIDRGRDRLPEVAAQHKVDAKELARMTEAVEDFAETAGGPARVALLMNEVVKKSAEGQERDSGKLMVLKRVARVVLRTQGNTSRKKDALNETLRKMIGIPMPVLRGLTPDDRVDLAGRLLFAETEDEALENARLMVFGHMLRNVDRYPVTANHLHAMAALLGLKARITGLDAEALLQRMAVLNPMPVLYDVELLDLEPFRDAIADPPVSALDRALVSGLDALIEAGEPMGDLDQRRLSALLQAVRHESAVMIGRPSWRTLFSAIQMELGPPVDKMVHRLTFLLGARTSRARVRLVQALGELIEVGRNALDAARFAEFCRTAAAEALSREVIEEYAAEAPEEFTPEKAWRPGAAEERAMVDQVLADLVPLGVDADEVRDNLPPVPRIATQLDAEEMTRMRVLAAGLEGCDIGQQEQLVLQSLKGDLLRTPHLAAMETMLGEGETVEMLRNHTAPEEQAEEPPEVEYVPRGLTGPMVDPRLLNGFDDPNEARRQREARKRSAEVLAARTEERWAAKQVEGAEDEDDPINRPLRTEEANPRIPQWAVEPSESADGELEETEPPAALPVPEDAAPIELPALERLIRNGELDTAAARVRAAPDGLPHLVDGLNLVALHFYVAGRRTAAGALWERALRLEPDRPNVLFNLARLRVEMGQPAVARPLLHRLLTQRPHLTPGRVLFAQVRDALRAAAR